MRKSSMARDESCDGGIIKGMEVAEKQPRGAKREKRVQKQKRDREAADTLREIVEELKKITKVMRNVSKVQEKRGKHQKSVMLLKVLPPYCAVYKYVLKKLMEEDDGESDATKHASDEGVGVDAGKWSEDTQHSESALVVHDERGNGSV